MKCPRCNYISFDDNPTCPKCGDDLSHERDLMNLPSYRAKPLSLLGRLIGDAQGPEVDVTMGGSGGLGGTESDTQDLLISLDSLSVEDEEPIQLEPVEPEPFLQGPQGEMNQDAGALDEDLTISLDDLMEEPAPLHLDAEPSVAVGETETDHLPDTPPELVIFEPEPEILSPEETIVDKGGAEPKAATAEVPQQEKVDFWEPEALAQRMADVKRDRAGQKEAGPDLMELELEPLELTLEMEEPDKKTP